MNAVRIQSLLHTIHIACATRRTIPYNTAFRWYMHVATTYLGCVKLWPQLASFIPQGLYSVPCKQHIRKLSFKKLWIFFSSRPETIRMTHSRDRLICASAVGGSALGHRGRRLGWVCRDSRPLHNILGGCADPWQLLCFHVGATLPLSFLCVTCTILYAKLSLLKYK